MTAAGGNGNSNACQPACTAGKSCVSGACVCSPGLSACGAACVDIKSDPLNCGQCGTPCGAGLLCSQGICSATCAVGETPCAGACVNLASSLSNCGQCSKVCAANETCSASACVSTGGGGAGAGGSGSASGGSNPGGAGASAGGKGGSGGGTGGPPPGRNGCEIKPGLISDFEEGTPIPAVITSEGRTGTWEMFNDKTSSTQTMTVESSGGTAACDKYALHVKGSGYSGFVGFGMTLAGTPAAPAVYNATSRQFTGIRFKAKLGSGADSKSPVRFNISTPWTEGALNPGGKCDEMPGTPNKAIAACYQHIGKFLPPGTADGEVTSTFKTFTYCFDRDLYPLSLPSNLTNVQRDTIAANILKVQFQFNQGKDYSGGYPALGAYIPFAPALPFDFWVDDISFFTGDCPNTTVSPTNGAPAKAFPQNTAVGSCAPATNAAKYSGAIAQAYARWTKNFVQGTQIVAPEQQNTVTSEAMGYGMMIAAAMGDKAAFDRFWSYVSPKLAGGLMTWKPNAMGSASDADADIAYALLMANAQWPSGGYKTPADSMATAILNNDLVAGVVRGGSMFKDAPFNASYFAPAAYRKFAGFAAAITTNYGLVSTNVSANSNGLPTDWANAANGQPSGPGSAQVTSEIQDAGGAMGYDAARVPWRLGLDACLGGGNTTALKAIVDFFAAKYDAGASIDLMKAGWIKSSGVVHPKAKDLQGSYIGPIGVGGMAMGNAAMRDRAFRTMLDILESGDFNHTYFPSTVGLLTLLAMSGNFPTP